MGMSIEKTMNELKTQIRYYKDFWGADASDYVIDAFNTAIDTMHKYQKIQEIYERFQKGYDHHMAWLDIMEVLEDGKIS